MRSFFSRGVSLIEVLIGFSIFVFVGMFFFNFLQSSAKQAAFSSEIFNAVALSQKVNEDILEELSLNPYGLETLGIINSKTENNRAVDRESIFFSYFEDQTAPFGVIDPEKDGGLNEKIQPLYDSVKNFTFGIKGNRMASADDKPEYNLLECEVNFAWKAQTGRGKYGSSLRLFSPVTIKKITPMLTIDMSSIDARIPEEVYNKSATIGELAAQTGENSQTILAIGRISIISWDFLNSPLFVSTAEKIKSLAGTLRNAGAADIETRYETTLALALSWYEMAKYCYQIIILLEPQFANLKANGKFTELSGSGINPIVFELSVMNFQIVYEYFVESLIQARCNFYNLLNPEIVKNKGGKMQLHAIQRLIDLYRVTALLKTRPGSINEYQNFLNRIRTIAKGRNPFLERMIAQEAILVNNPNKWFERYPNLNRLSSTLSIRIPEIFSFIDETRDALLQETLQNL